MFAKSGFSAVKALASIQYNSKIVWECLQNLNDNNVTIAWVLGHRGVTDNELVRKGSGIPLTTIKKSVDKIFQYFKKHEDIF